MERLASRQVYANQWMSVREDRVRYPDGSTGTYGVMDSADIALIVPARDGRLLLVEQYRYPVEGRRWEFPSGSIDLRLDAGPAEAAARELHEESGLVPGTMTLLGTLETAPSTMSQRCQVFLATDLTHALAQRDVEEQGMRTKWFPRAEVEQMISAGIIADSKSAAAYVLLLLHRATASERSASAKIGGGP